MSCGLSVYSPSTHFSAVSFKDLSIFCGLSLPLEEFFFLAFLGEENDSSSSGFLNTVTNNPSPLVKPGMNRRLGMLPLTCPDMPYLPASPMSIGSRPNVSAIHAALFSSSEVLKVHVE